MVISEIIELTPILMAAFRTASTLFLLISIAKLLGAEIDRLLFLIFTGLSLFFTFYMFYVTEALAVGLVILIMYSLYASGKKPKNVRFVPPEFEGIRRIDDERE